MHTKSGKWYTAEILWRYCGSMLPLIWISNIFPYTGNSDLGLSSIDPFEIAEMKMTQETGPVVIDVMSTDDQYFGLSKGNFHKFHGFEHGLLEIGLKVPALVYKASYTISGQILILPVTGDGTIDLTLSK